MFIIAFTEPDPRHDNIRDGHVVLGGYTSSGVDADPLEVARQVDTEQEDSNGLQKHINKKIVDIEYFLF